MKNTDRGARKSKSYF